MRSSDDVPNPITSQPLFRSRKSRYDAASLPDGVAQAKANTTPLNKVGLPTGDALTVPLAQSMSTTTSTAQQSSVSEAHVSKALKKGAIRQYFTSTTPPSASSAVRGSPAAALAPPQLVDAAIRGQDHTKRALDSGDSDSTVARTSTLTSFASARPAGILDDVADGAVADTADDLDPSVQRSAMSYIGTYQARFIAPGEDDDDMEPLEVEHEMPTTAMATFTAQLDDGDIASNPEAKSANPVTALAEPPSTDTIKAEAADRQRHNDMVRKRKAALLKPVTAAAASSVASSSLRDSIPHADANVNDDDDDSVVMGPPLPVNTSSSPSLKRQPGPVRTQVIRGSDQARSSSNAVASLFSSVSHIQSVVPSSTAVKQDHTDGTWTARRAAASARSSPLESLPIRFSAEQIEDLADGRLLRPVSFIELKEAFLHLETVRVEELVYL